MHFAKARNLAAMALAWALFLLAYDQHANPRPVATYWADFMGSLTRPTVLSEGGTPRLRLSLPHLCYVPERHPGGARGANLARSRAWTPSQPPWKPPPRTRPTPRRRTSSSLTSSIAQANFVALDAALRDAGSVPDRIEIFGMGHFRLEVELPRCCTACSRAVDDQFGAFSSRRRRAAGSTASA